MRIDRLMDDALRDPSTGFGKPELLRHMLAVRGPRGSAKSIAWSISWTAATS
jgi:YoeB-like toxin of bacterial type II toxin-antitoxin system